MIGSRRVVNAVTPKCTFVVCKRRGVGAPVSPDCGCGGVVFGGVDTGVTFDVDVEAVAGGYFVAFCCAG